MEEQVTREEAEAWEASGNGGATMGEPSLQLVLFIIYYTIILYFITFVKLIARLFHVIVR